MSSVDEALLAAGLGPVAPWTDPIHDADREVDREVDRDSGPADARTVPSIAPRSEEAWCKALALAEAHDWVVRLAGGHTKRHWLPLTEDVDLVLSTAAWRGVVAYEPADGTLTARSGTTMAELASVVLEGGHHLSPEVAHPERATLGGVLAAGQSGLDRLRPGSIRDALLGARVLLADGSSSQSGGRLVKNVTGYDLHRLWCGSFGSLCAILEVSLRLGPSLGSPHVLELPCSGLDEGLKAAIALRELPVRPIAVVLELTADPSRGETPAEDARLFVVLGGLREVRDEEARTLRARFPQARELPDDEATRVRCGLRDASNPELAHLVLQGPPAGLAAALHLDDWLPHGSLWLHPLVAEATFVPAPSEQDSLAQLAARLRARLEEMPTGAAPGAVRIGLRDGRTPPLAIPSSAVLRMHAELNASFDPQGRFARARFWRQDQAHPGPSA